MRQILTEKLILLIIIFIIPYSASSEDLDEPFLQKLIQSKDAGLLLNLYKSADNFENKLKIINAAYHINTNDILPVIDLACKDIYLNNKDFAANSQLQAILDNVLKTINSLKAKNFQEILYKLSIIIRHNPTYHNIIHTLGIIGDRTTGVRLSKILSEAFLAKMENKTVNENNVIYLLEALGKIKQGVSFKDVFQIAYSTAFSKAITEKAQDTLDRIETNHISAYNALFRESNLTERMAVIVSVFSSQKLLNEEKIEALDQILKNIILENKTYSAEQYEQAELLFQKLFFALGALGGGKATPAMIQFFEKKARDIDSQIFKEDTLLVIINALGLTKNHDASLSLSLFLKKLNIIKNEKKVSESLFIIVIEALGKIGNSLAVEPLSETYMQDHSANIKTATLTALEKCQK